MESSGSVVTTAPPGAESLSAAGVGGVDSPRTETELRLARLARAVLVALGLAVVMAAFAGAGIGADAAASPTADDARLGGDFPAFYGAGSIVWSGDIDQLYDPGRQEAAQTALGIDGYLAFAYPPHVAAAYAPLSALDFQLAYVVHTALMAAAFVAAVVVLSGPVPLLRRWRWPILAAGFTFFPLFTAVGGGQNAPVTMLLLALVWRGLHDDRPALAGLAAGLMLYRPQYALPVMGLLLLSREARALAWAGATGAATWAGTALVLGANWVANWFDEVVPFVERDAEVNAANSISILGFLQAAWGADARPAVVLGALGAAAVVLVLMAMWVRPERFSLASRMGALAIGITLISPHTMFYDASLLLLAGAALLASSSGMTRGEQTSAGVVRVLALTWAAAFLHLTNDGLGATPLAVVVFVAFVAFVITSVQNRPQVQRGGVTHA